MMLRFPMTAILLPMILASVGCVGTATESYSDEDEIASSDGAIAAPVDESIDSSADSLMQAEPCLIGEDCGVGGGGGPPPPPPPPPPTDTSASYLNAAARAYLAQTGVSDASTVGGTRWVNACRVSAEQGSVTFNSGKTQMCPYASPAGWVILETAYEVITNKHGRGGASVGTANGPISFSTVDFGSKFNAAISLAASAGDVSAEKKLQLEYQRLNGYSYVFNGTGNNLIATVTANGGLFQSSYIEIQAKAKLLRVY